jgi:hypothetical protein
MKIVKVKQNNSDFGIYKLIRYFIGVLSIHFLMNFTILPIEIQYT